MGDEIFSEVKPSSLSLAVILHHQRNIFTVDKYSSTDPRAADPNIKVKASSYQCRPVVVSVRVWFVTAGGESPGKFSSEDRGEGPSAACLMDAEWTGWVSVLRVTTQGSEVGQWAESALRGDQTTWAAEQAAWKVSEKVDCCNC